jgi:hypothetical protein
MRLLMLLCVVVCGLSAQTAVPAASAPSWYWVHAGVAAELLGNGLDWATSWKQPEGNQLLAETGGRYSGDLYRVGTARKASTAVGLAVVSYAIAWRWPRTRKWVGVFDLGMGAWFVGVAASNVARNPYYR